MDYETEAFSLYKLTGDPLVLDAIKVLANPEHPHYDTAKEMVERMVEARQTLFPPS